jgi:hypothetical protein
MICAACPPKISSCSPAREVKTVLVHLAISLLLGRAAPHSKLNYHVANGSSLDQIDQLDYVCGRPRLDR